MDRIIDAPVSRVDFSRPLVTILGLPFDVVDLDEAVARIRADAFAGRRCFLSTPNLNFAMASRSDAAFRGSVLRSDLSVVDGMPLVWIARLLGLPIRQRVSGSDVFEALQGHGETPIDVFFFGGPPGVAARAAERVNRRGGGLRCVGFDEPGFGSTESMSTEAQIQRINACRPHFVIVALGAKKGQAWIEHNADRLTAPVLSHLGAVVNFAAGGVARAPRWVQRCGGEWLWRIKEEPGLWRRYWSDGLQAVAAIFRFVLPDAAASRFAGGGANSQSARLEVQQESQEVRIRLLGSWDRLDVAPLTAALTRASDANARVLVDLSGTESVGNRLVSVLLLASAWFGPRGGFRIVGASASVGRSFSHKLAGELLAE